MGKLIRMFYRSPWRLDIWQGGFLFYTEDQLGAIKDALVKFQQKNDTKAAIMISLAHTSGQVCFIMTTSLLVQPDVKNSSWPLSGIFMMGPLIREYSTISWQSPLPRGMSQQDLSLT
jgi:hypothetical protein